MILASTDIEVFAARSLDGLCALIQFEEGGKIITEKVMNADELGDYIRSLAKLRATLVDQVPRKLDSATPIFDDVTREGVFHVDRQHKVGKEFFIACRHEGYGWLAFTFTAESGEILVNLINRQIEGMRPIIQQPKNGIII